MSKLLINEPPLQVLPTLACYVGLNESVFLQQVHYWLQNTKVGKMADGRKWVRNSMSEWEEQFPFWSKNVIRRTIKNLIGDGLLLHRDDLNAAGYDRTAWYSINYDVLDDLGEPVERMNKKSDKRKLARASRDDENDVSQVQNAPPPVHDVPPVQNVPPKGTKCTPQRYKMYPTIPETPTETPTETHTIEGDESLELAWGKSLSLCGNSEETAAALWSLTHHFVDVSGMGLPDIDKESGIDELATLWWPQLLEIYSAADSVLGAAKQVIGTAVVEQRSWKQSSVSTPKSIRKKSLAIIAGQKMGTARANGHMPANDLGQYQIAPMGM